MVIELMDGCNVAAAAAAAAAVSAVVEPQFDAVNFRESV